MDMPGNMIQKDIRFSIAKRAGEMTTLLEGDIVHFKGTPYRLLIEDNDPKVILDFLGGIHDPVCVFELERRNVNGTAGDERFSILRRFSPEAFRDYGPLVLALAETELDYCIYIEGRSVAENTFSEVSES